MDTEVTALSNTPQTLVTLSTQWWSRNEFQEPNPGLLQEMADIYSRGLRSNNHCPSILKVIVPLIGVTEVMVAQQDSQIIEDVFLARPSPSPSDYQFDGQIAAQELQNAATVYCVYALRTQNEGVKESCIQRGAAFLDAFASHNLEEAAKLAVQYQNMFFKDTSFAKRHRDILRSIQAVVTLDIISRLDHALSYSSVSLPPGLTLVGVQCALYVYLMTLCTDIHGLGMSDLMSRNIADWKLQVGEHCYMPAEGFPNPPNDPAWEVLHTFITSNCPETNPTILQIQMQLNRLIEGLEHICHDTEHHDTQQQDTYFSAKANFLLLGWCIGIRSWAGFDFCNMPNRVNYERTAHLLSLSRPFIIFRQSISATEFMILIKKIWDLFSEDEVRWYNRALGNTGRPSNQPQMGNYRANVEPEVPPFMGL